MSNINKQELREAAERAESDSWGYDRDEFNEALTPSTVLALLDELEAKDSMIAAQQHEIRTLLNALEGRPCPKCNDTGMADSGGTQPWGEPISVPCDCAAPPAPVSVPDEIPKLKDGRGFKYVKDRVRYSVNYANGWNACRAAMLQGADGTLTNEGTIPVTQFKPVADLYGLTSPTGGETSFTFDAVEARDFIDGGWLCQEYVTLERYQEAITNHTEDKLAMVDHSGDSNNMVEPVTTAYKLRDAVETIRSSGIAIDADKIFAERDVLNSPVIPDGWVMVPEEPTHEMLEAGDEQFGTYDVYRRMLASAPQQEA
ncbi:ead/Ea22-like family protein [Enterobacter hormaechei]|uniref:ead/Ea22-like family protein n=1 Tax=Enterobacter cloacae complex TaxID=354276 RepID=UPI0007988E1F|nr:ead/Ea22-like family protein [Enterobacter hormaechei]SAC08573.1 Uncharacterised protein [Enterobacter hormaechei]